MTIRSLLSTAALTAGLWLLGAANAAGQNDGEVTVAVLSINDFHGAFVPRPDRGLPGAAALWQTMDSLRSAYPLHVVVAAGDNFGGSYFYKATDGTLLPPLFAGLGIRLSAVGNHEFDDGQAALADKWSASPLRPEGWDLQYVCANVRDSAGRVPSFATPCAVERLRLPSGRELSVGFVGLLTSTTPLQASASRLRGLTFDGRYDRVLDSVARLPEFEAVRDADIRLLLTHIGTRMQQGRPVWDDPGAEALEQLSDTLWHGILTAHSHEAVCGRIGRAQLPVVQGQWHGQYVSVLKISFDTLTNRLTHVWPELCPVRVTSRPSQGAERMQALIDSCLQHTTTAGGTPIGQHLTTAPRRLVHDRTDKWHQTEMGTLVCEAYAEAFRTAAGLPLEAVVVGASHFGSIRAGFEPGGVTVLDVGEALPFSNALRAYDLSVAQLRALVDFGLHNQTYGWLQTSWLEVEMNDEGHVSQLVYAAPDGSRRTLRDDDRCVLVADEFITTGGDGYSPSFFPADRELHAPDVPATTDAFINYLRRFATLPLRLAPSSPHP